MIIDVWAVFRWVILYCSGVYGDSKKELARIPMNQLVFMKWDIIKFLFCCHYQLHSGNPEASFQSTANSSLKVIFFNREKEGVQGWVSFCNWRFVNTNGSNELIWGVQQFSQSNTNPDEPKNHVNHDWTGWLYQVCSLMNGFVAQLHSPLNS